jgi:hypothetical protein
LAGRQLTKRTVPLKSSVHAAVRSLSKDAAQALVIRQVHHEREYECNDVSNPAGQATSGAVPLVVLSEIEASSCEMDYVLPDFVAKQAPRGPVMFQRYCETPCKRAQP